MEEDHIEKHSMTQSIILHLLPGILVGCFYFLVRQPVANMGYPSIFALLLAFAFISFLFAAVHVFTPWMVITRTLGLLPLLFGVKKKNIYVGMIVHILGNSVALLTGIVFITRMP